MKIYIVVGELDGYQYRGERETVSDFETEASALSHAVDLAKGEISKGGTSQIYKLKKIIELNTGNLNAKELELVLTKGEFKLEKVAEETTNQFDG